MNRDRARRLAFAAIHIYLLAWVPVLIYGVVWAFANMALMLLFGRTPT